MHPLLNPKGEKNPTRRAATNASKPSSTLLDDIKFERKNKPQPRLPPNHMIQKRPIIHPPIASPFAGPDVQKVVYVSKNTPIMSAVKRVKKLLEQAEKRNLQREGVLGTGRRQANIAAAGQKKQATIQEKVLVKGSGRAIEQAARVGEWFKRHAEDGDGGWLVNVTPTSVKVIDDIVEDSSTDAAGVEQGNDHTDDSLRADESPLDHAEDGSIGQHENPGGDDAGNGHSLEQIGGGQKASPAKGTALKDKKSAPKKRKRPTYDEDDVPEARTRFINAIEIAVSLGD